MSEGLNDTAFLMDKEASHPKADSLAREVHGCSVENLNDLDGFWLVDEQGCLLEVNDTYCRMCGFSRKELLTKRMTDLVAIKPEETVDSQMNEIKKKGSLRFETQHRRKDGTIFDVEVSAKHKKDDGRIFIFLRDITERKQEGEKIKALLAEKNLLLREVHHRIKNNMGIVRSLLALQANSTREPAVIMALTDARNRLQSMSILYEKLYITPDYTELSIKDYLSSLVDEILANFPESRMITVEKNIQDFFLDIKRLQSIGIILNELLTNSMKYAFQGKEQGLMTVSVSKKDNDVMISIQDDGTGFPESVSVENSYGFGLQLVHALAQQLDGMLRVERNAGTNTILEFKIQDGSDC